MEWDTSLPEVIKEVWDAVGVVQNLSQLRDALSKTMSTLGLWSKKSGNVTRELAKSSTQLEEFMHMNAARQDIKRVIDKMNGLLYQEEMLWLQRSRMRATKTRMFFKARSRGGQGKIKFER